jgi:hypothetical protein
MKSLTILLFITLNFSYANESPKSGATMPTAWGIGATGYPSKDGFGMGATGYPSIYGMGAGLGFCTPSNDETTCETVDGRVYKLDKSVNQLERHILKEHELNRSPAKKNNTLAGPQ